MIKQTISYTDFNDDASTETLYFNISKAELLENLELKDKLEKLQQTLSGDVRELDLDEVKHILEIVKTFIRLSYGVRSEDGKRFAKSSQLFEEFTQTAAYDAFLMSLFEDPNKAIEFMLGVMPADLRAQAQAEVEKAAEGTIELPTAPPVLESKDDGSVSDEELLKMDPQKMTPEQLRRAFVLKQSA